MLLYVVLAFVFILIIVVLAAYTPSISGYLLGVSSTLSFLTTEEALHMHDVRSLVIAGLAFAGISVAVLLGYHRWRPLRRETIRDALIVNIGLLLLLIPFATTFDYFHQLFFPQGNWQFPVHSWLISHYPPAFFVGAAIVWIGGSAALLALLLRKSIK